MNDLMPATPLARSPQSQVRVWGAILVVLGIVVYGNSLWVPFTLDDASSIVTNHRIRRIWPPWALLASGSRPIAELSFALNYAWDGLNVFGYHLVNVAIHLSAALVLFGLVRRTLSGSRVDARFRQASLGLALATAMVWMVHPLQTQSVTYLVQRMESLMGLFYLLTLYCFLRAQDSSRFQAWYAASITFCGLGMVTKEVMVTAPLMVLWYDRVFVADSWRQILQRRRWFYLALAGTWGILALVMITGWPVADPGALRVPGVSALDYALTQPGVILHYLRLSFWPQGQCLDAMWPVARTAAQIVPQLLGILALLGLTVWCVFRRPMWGFVGGWFFVILGPTSSIAPIKDLAFEHRMYLSLAAVAVLVVIGGYAALDRVLRIGAVPAVRRPAICIGAISLAVAALAAATYLRNQVWQSRVSMWGDVVAKAPHNWRARNNLADSLSNEERYSDALEQYREALRLFPENPQAHRGLGIALFELGQTPEALEHFRELLRLRPNEADTHFDLGMLSVRRGDLKKACDDYREALRLDPDHVGARANLALLLAETDPDAAIGHYRAALAADALDAQSHNQLGLFQEKRRDLAAAEEHFREAVRLDRKSPEPRVNLARMLERDQPELAIKHYERALSLRPNYPEAHNNLGALLIQRGRAEEAVEHLNEALRLRPDYVNAHLNLAVALAKTNRRGEARKHLDEALRIKPDYRSKVQGEPTLRLLLEPTPTGRTDAAPRTDETRPDTPATPAP